MLKHSTIEMVLVCVAAYGCSQGPQVKDPATPTATARPAAASEPGPKDADAPTDFTTTESGLKYRILRKGSGKKPTKSSEVTVNYKGWLKDPNDPFDQSYGKEPFMFSPARPVIPGWVEGAQYVGEGGMIELEIPPELGYGPDGMPPVIPPNAILHFIVEVLQVN